jgi:uncharacterized protein (DUF1501 family)
MISRRVFLKSGAMAFVAAGLGGTSGPLWLREAAWAAPTRASNRRKTLVCLFQRGAVDGLSMVVPHGDPFYYRHRTAANGGIAIPRTGEGRVLDLDGRFGLHPALAPLLPMWKSKHLAAVQAVGSPNSTRSHFDAQDYMESGAPGNKGVRDGWLARALLACPEDARKRRTAFGGLAMSASLPRSLSGADALAIPDLRTFGVKDTGVRIASLPLPAIGRRNGAMDAPSTSGAAGSASSGFEALYEDAVGDVMHGAGKESFEAIKVIQNLKPGSYRPERGARYPRGRFGDSLQQIAQLIKADVGVEVAFAESGGWDTHVGQGGAQGNLSRRLGEFAQGMAALYLDLGDRMADVVILSMSEFGRTARQNGNGGTDHGHGTCFLALGDKVNGGQVLGDWPGLAPEQLFENRDLAITTDFRAVFGEVAAKHMGIADLGQVFPRWEGSTSEFRNVLHA